MNVALAGMVVLMVSQNRGYVYPGILIYAMAAYSFYTVIIRKFYGNIEKVDDKTLIQRDAGAKTHILRKPFDQGDTKHFPGQRMIFDPLCEFPYDAGTSCDGYDQRIGGQDIYRIRQRPEESLIQYINHQRKGGERDAEGRQRRQEKYPCVLRLAWRGWRTLLWCGSRTLAVVSLQR